MKTTVEIPDALAEDIRKLAAREGTTVKVLIEQGLRKVLAERRQRNGTFRLRKATFKGNGLQPGVAGVSWERIREMAYEARGA
jgi:ribbon-helix-helix CopG family protein